MCSIDVCDQCLQSKDFYDVEIPVKAVQGDRRKGALESEAMMKIPIVLVHELFEFLSQEKGVSVTRESVQQFWDHFLGVQAAWAQLHPASAEKVHIPFGLHGDDCTYTVGGSKLIIISANVVLWDPKNSWMSRFLVCALRESISLGVRTLDPIWKVIAWFPRIA